MTLHKLGSWALLVCTLNTVQYKYVFVVNKGRFGQDSVHCTFALKIQSLDRNWKYITRLPPGKICWYSNLGVPDPKPHVLHAENRSAEHEHATCQKHWLIFPPRPPSQDSQAQCQGFLDSTASLHSFLRRYYSNIKSRDLLMPNFFSVKSLSVHNKIVCATLWARLRA